MSLESVPNYSTEVRRLFDTGLFTLTTHDGQGAFADACVSMLHGRNARWGHLKKKPGQTAVHGHGEDAALFLFADGRAQAVDFIGGAGGPNPQPGWIVDPEIRYTTSDWLDPTEHGRREAPAPTHPQYPPYPPNESDVDGAGVALFADFGQAGQPPNPQMFRFAFRVAFSWLTKEVPDLPASVAKHRSEWRAILGLPPL